MKKNTLLIILLCLSTLSSKAQWTTVCNTGNGFVVTFANFQNSIYSTGFFTENCGIASNHVNKWDGTNWAPVDTGLSDPGHRLVVIDTQLYVAKYQQNVDSNWLYKLTANGFAKVGESVYLTTANVGTSLTANIYDVVKYRGQLIISGEFDLASGKHITGIARLNGTQWDSLGTGLAGSLDGSGILYPHEMLLHDTSLYVVGNFVTAGGVTCNGVARWDGTTWHAMGAGFNSVAYSIGTYNDTLYAGGGFSASAGHNMRCIAKWDGTNWVNPGFGVYYTTPGLRPYVHTVEQIGSYMFFTGGFDKAINGVDTTDVHAIMGFDGTQILTLSGGLPNEEIEALVPYSTGLLAGGGYNNDSTFIARYDFAGLKVANVNQRNVEIYPNPAINTIYFNGIKAGEKVQAYNLLGKKVYSAILTNTKGTIDISSFLPGSYLFRFADGTNAAMSKIIIKQ